MCVSRLRFCCVTSVTYLDIVHDATKYFGCLIDHLTVTGSFPCAQLPGPVYTGWAECVLYLAYVCILYVCIALICLCVSILLCFPGQLGHLPYSLGLQRD